MPPTMLISPEPKPNRMAKAIAPGIDGAVRSSTARPAASAPVAPSASQVCAHAAAEQHVDEAARHLRRPEQAGDEHAGRAQADRRHQRHHVHEDGREHETLDGEAGQHQEEDRRPARARHECSRRSAAATGASSVVRRAPRSRASQAWIGRQTTMLSAAKIAKTSRQPKMLVQHRRQRPEQRRGKAGDQGQVRDAALRVAPAELDDRDEGGAVEHEAGGELHRQHADREADAARRQRAEEQAPPRPRSSPAPSGGRRRSGRPNVRRTAQGRRSPAARPRGWQTPIAATRQARPRPPAPGCCSCSRACRSR